MLALSTLQVPARFRGRQVRLHRLDPKTFQETRPRYATRSLVLSMYPLTEEEGQIIADTFPFLEEICVLEPRSSSVIPVSLASKVKVISLALRAQEEPILHYGREALSKLEHINELRVIFLESESWPEDGQDLNFLRGKSIRKLVVGGTQVVVQEWRVLREIQSLEELEVYGIFNVMFLDEFLDGMKHLKKLTCSLLGHTGLAPTTITTIPNYRICGEATHPDTWRQSRWHLQSGPDIGILTRDARINDPTLKGDLTRQYALANAKTTKSVAVSAHSIALVGGHEEFMRQAREIAALSPAELVKQLATVQNDGALAQLYLRAIDKVDTVIVHANSGLELRAVLQNLPQRFKHLQIHASTQDLTQEEEHICNVLRRHALVSLDIRMNDCRQELAQELYQCHSKSLVRQRTALALLVARHPRLGANSPFRALSMDLIHGIAAKIPVRL